MNQLIPFINSDTGRANPIHRDFSNVRASAGKDAPNGGGEGCGNVTGYLDSWGTMLLPGAFKNTIPFLLKSGFLCDGHGRATSGYTEGSNLGYFTKVFEDEEGLQLEWAYHSKPHAQDARTTLAERLAADKTSGLSIGFFVGDGRSTPVGWEYDPEGEMPKGIDYISVQPIHIKEVLIEVSKPEYLKENLARAESCPWGIYLFCNVHVFETSQTLVPANEVSLIAEVRDSSKPKSITQMAKEKVEPEKDDDEPNQDDTLQAVQRVCRAMKNEHREHDRIMRDHISTLAGHLEKLSGKKDEDDEEEPEEKPKKGKEKPDEEKPKEEKKSRAQKLFENGGKL
jgi:hypothetical protein